MNYSKDQLLAIQPPMVIIPFVLTMRPRGGKHPNQIGSYARNLITVPITPYNGRAIQNESIGLINCQVICNKSDEISDVVGIWILILLSLQILG